MAYEVTATRKRPQVFDRITGQDFFVTTIKHAIEQGRIAHAYLFSGPRGVGKTSSARILAKALNCEQGPTATPCGVCSSCKEITAGNSLDVIEIDGASNTSVNDVRVIKDEVMFPPQGGRYKIYIIDEVHMLSTSAFNALLKTIEEPPEYIVFMFATTETQKVPATIRSRCQHFHFQLIPLEMIKQRLAEAAHDMKVKADEDALFWMAKESTGSLRDAYTLFDQIVAFSGSHITLAEIQQKLGLASPDHISSILFKAFSGDTAQALTLLEEMLAKGIAVEQCVKDFSEYFRTLLLVKTGITDETVLGISTTHIPTHLVAACTAEQLEAACELFLKLYRDIRYSLNPRFELELAVSRLTTLPQLTSPTTMQKQLQSLQQSLIGGTPLPQRPLATPPRPAQKKEEPVQKEAKPFKPIDGALLGELQEHYAKQNSPLAPVFVHASSLSLESETLIIRFNNGFAADRAEQNLETIRKTLKDLTGYTGPVRCEKKVIVTQKKEDKTIQSIATLFHGEVISEDSHE